jgi:hypothetical protein
MPARDASRQCVRWADTVAGPYAEHLFQIGFQAVKSEPVNLYCAFIIDASAQVLISFNKD